MTSALLIVDVQNDFASAQGSLYVPGGEQVAEEISKHVQDSYYDYILVSKDWHIQPGEHFASHTSKPPNYVDTWPDHCVAGSWGARFHSSLKLLPDAIFLKGGYTAAYSAFEGTNHFDGKCLDDWLKGHFVDHLCICGIALDFCVAETVKDSVKLGYLTTLLPKLTVSIGDKETEMRKLQQETKCFIYLGE